ncbi:flagellar brake protein [Oceanobacillus sp. Castelsardo]|uniref:flagellar brake protein n=1 Tax=Oceanobacillus sp. Castelsardo TaxID=1851204 RepID=UPI0008384092|nr:flagellar brake domain-containing protein [Oceanobacillus sp. Castelsardo]
MKIGSSITLEVREAKNKVIKYRCKIIEETEQYLVVDYPISIHNNKTTYLAVGTRVSISFIDNKAVYQFNSKIQSRINSKIPALVIPYPEKEEIHRIQRRKFVRVETAVDIAIHSVKNKFQAFTGVTSDISGGGLSFTIQEDRFLEISDHLNLFIVLPMASGDFEYLTLNGEIVYQKKLKNTLLRTSVKFNNITTKEQQIIVRFCFEREREIRKKELQ